MAVIFKIMGSMENRHTSFSFTSKHVKLFILAQGIYLVLYNISLTRITILRGLSLIPHELGHTLAGWSFAYFSVPSIAGGGMTMYFSRGWLLIVIILALFFFGFFRWLRLNDYRLKLTTLLFVLFYLCAFCSVGIHQGIMSMMGHIGEAIAGFCACYLGLSPYHTQRSQTEKNMIFIMGVILLTAGFHCAYCLVFDSEFIDMYTNRPDMDNDFVVMTQKTWLPLGFFAFFLAAVNGLAVFLLNKALKNYRYNILADFFSTIKALYRFNKNRY